MNKTIFTISLIYTLAISDPAYATQSKIAPSKNASEMTQPSRSSKISQTMETLSFSPSDIEYPKTLSSTGVQGRILLNANMKSDGSLSDIVIAESSRSLHLDLAAVQVVKNLQYQLKQPLPDKTELSVQIPLEFKKDSYLTINQKSCTEFNQDFNYLTNTFPEQTLEEAEVFRIPLGSIFLFLSPEQKIMYAKRGNLIREVIVQECAKNPQQLLMQLIRKLTQGILT